MILGIDLGGTNIRVGQIDMEGGTQPSFETPTQQSLGIQTPPTHLLKGKIVLPSRADLPLEESLVYLKSVVARMMTPEVTAIGVGVPSVVDVERGIVYNAANIASWREVHLKDLLMSEFNVPVYINNDANCFALGEARFGAGVGFSDVVGVTLGTGVGAGLVLGGRLYGGRNTGAGEISSLPYRDATYEHFCSSEFFLSHYKTTGHEAALRAREGDSAARSVWEEFGAHLGRFMHAVLYAYDPELVVLGGGIAEANDLWESAMRRELDSFPYPATVQNLRIDISRNPDIAILGAAALATDHNN